MVIISYYFNSIFIFTSLGLEPDSETDYFDPWHGKYTKKKVTEISYYSYPSSTPRREFIVQDTFFDKNAGIKWVPNGFSVDVNSYYTRTYTNSIGYENTIANTSTMGLSGSIPYTNINLSYSIQSKIEDKLNVDFSSSESFAISQSYNFKYECDDGTQCVRVLYKNANTNMIKITTTYYQREISATCFLNTCWNFEYGPWGAYSSSIDYLYSTRPTDIGYAFDFESYEHREAYRHYLETLSPINGVTHPLRARYELNPTFIETSYAVKLKDDYLNQYGWTYISDNRYIR